MNNVFREPLESGGELVVYESGCRIEYYFEGPDERYGGLHVTIHADEIDSYIMAWKRNFHRLEELKAQKDKRPLAESGECGMLIRAGLMEGVYLRRNHMRIATRQALERVVRDYEYAASKGKKLIAK